MIFRRFYNEQLSQASFMVGCNATGEAIVIDPNRHFEQYLDAAAEDGLIITAATETHIHADYLSGSRELATLTGARLYLSDEGDAEWKYRFATEPNVTLIKGRDSIRVGKVRLDAVHTPGHTPEHLSFLLIDEATCSSPLGVFTGDFVFVGDVGRPDLLEKAAGYEGTMEKGAGTLYASLLCFKELAPELIVWPGHGAGSSCGKALSAVPYSTLAYEKVANWAFRDFSEDEFVRVVLDGQPEPPVYFKEMKRLNRDGPPFLGSFSVPQRLSGDRLLLPVGEAATILDIRAFGEVATGYVAEAINIPLDESFVTWAGWLVPYGKPIYLIANDARGAEEAARQLLLIGLDDVRGWFGKDAIRAYEKARGTLPVTSQVGMEQAASDAKKGEAVLLDVRSSSEYAEGHAPGAAHIPLGYLASRAIEVPTDRPVYIHCGGGGRSAIAVSVLHRLGFENVSNIPGGFYEYRELGLPIESGLPVPSAVQ